MVPIKFEDNIREKLQEREIQPSKNAWKKLNYQLNPNPQNRTNKSFWFAVAAGFIGILIIASLLFKNQISLAPITTDLVEENINNIKGIDKKEEFVLSEKETLNETLKETSIAEKSVEKEKQQVIKEQNIKIENNSVLAVNSGKPIKETSVTKELGKKENNNKLKISKEEVFINSKVDEVIAQVQALYEEKDSVSMEEINSLLLNAQKEIQAQKIMISKNTKVDATALLNTVESELEKSFRDKVFEALGNSYEKVRTAVVERNN